MMNPEMRDPMATEAQEARTAPSATPPERTPEDEMRRALNALYLACEVEVAEDVNEKVGAAYAALRAEVEGLREALERITELIDHEREPLRSRATQAEIARDSVYSAIDALIKPIARAALARTQET